ncbi:MAG: hypothetical protein ACR2N5_03585 [Solirubrobacterales bacterium]
MTRIVPSSVARNAGFEQTPPDPIAIPREEWRRGDFVVAEVLASGSVPYFIETPSGRMAELAPGDLIVGAFGRRAATLEIVGDWREVDDSVMQVLVPGGVLGRCTSAAATRQPMADVRYLGHAHIDGNRQSLGSGAWVADRRLEAPIVLLIGTSMDAGKTVAGRAIVRQLKRAGARVAGIKVTGVGRYKDILALHDAGADFIADFVDAGLPSTVVPAEDFRVALRRLCALVADSEPDVVVAEAGASPLEPYNGDEAVRELGERVKLVVLCASDPYAVAGVMSAFGLKPDLVSGRATSTSAGIELIERLVGVPSMNLLEPAESHRLSELLTGALGDLAVRS